jgi:cardiolipin synthase A/B
LGRKAKTLLSVAAAIFALLAVLFVAVNLKSGEKQVRQKPAHSYSVDDPQFLRAVGVLLGPPVTGGNRTATLLNGDQIFPAMLQAIRAASKTITFETYIYWSGDIGREFANALANRARAGVKVHVLLDWVGSQKMEASYLQEMQEAGVAIVKYHPPSWYTLNKLNNRTHRKLLVVDGHVGFIGGVGIADKWTGNAGDPEHWRDTHYRIEGPAVAQMQAAFADNWTKVTGAVFHTAEYLPPLKEAGSQYAQVFKSSIDGGAESMHLMYLLSIAASVKSIQLSMAYFVPDDLTLSVMLDALRRGVKIQIILPGPITDAELVQRASRAKWGEIMQAGGEIYQYQPTMFHCKVLVVDGLWVSVGSTNFDSRSFRLNDEANLNVYDAGFAAEQIRIFAEDLKRSRRVSFEEWQSRPWTEKLWENSLALLSAQL